MAKRGGGVSSSPIGSYKAWMSRLPPSQAHIARVTAVATTQPHQADSQVIYGKYT